MPTASAKLRKYIENHFGSTEDSRVVEYLERVGFCQTKDFCWTRAQRPSFHEQQCINFLIEEWDWGGYSED